MSALEDLAQAVLDGRLKYDPPTGKIFVNKANATPPREDQLLASAAKLPATRKLEVLAAMGFTRFGADHQEDCPYNIDAGYRCNCVPPTSSWSAPEDVQIELKETWADRLEQAKKPRPIYEVER